MEWITHRAAARTALLSLLCGILTLSSCKHRSRTASPEAGTPIAGTPSDGLASKTVEMLNARRQTGQFLTAKASVRLQAGQKDVSVSGTLRMKRDDVIQLSLAFLGLMEVGRMEITPDYFLLVDRMNHRYVRVGYADVPFFQKAGIDFHTFQSLFWGELFLPGDGGKAPQGKDFKHQVSGDTLSLTVETHARTVLHFMASMSRALLLGTSVDSRAGSAVPLVSWDYSDYKPFAGKQFPSGMRMRLSSGTMKAQVTLGLSNLKDNSDWGTRTEVNTRKYRQVPVESILGMLKGLSQSQ